MGRSYVPPEQYIPGTLQTKSPVVQEAPKMAISPIKEAPPEYRAKRQLVDQDGHPVQILRSTPPPGENPEAEATSGPVLNKISRATRVLSTPAEPTEPDWMEELTPEERTAIEERKKSPGGVEKAFVHLQRKLGEQGTTITALKQQVEDVILAKNPAHAGESATLQPAQTPPDVAALQKEIDEAAKEFGKTYLDKPEEHFKKLVDLSTRKAKAEMAQSVHQVEDKAQIEAGKMLLAEYPGLFSTDKKKASAEAAYVDALASQYGPPTMETYRKALDTFAKERTYIRPATALPPNADVEAMKKAATESQAPAAATVKVKGKIWTRHELGELLTKYPEKYRAMQTEITRAYAEGRVK